MGSRAIPFPCRYLRTMRDTPNATAAATSAPASPNTNGTATGRAMTMHITTPTARMTNDPSTPSSSPPAWPTLLVGVALRASRIPAISGRNAHAPTTTPSTAARIIPPILLTLPIIMQPFHDSAAMRRQPMRRRENPANGWIAQNWPRFAVIHSSMLETGSVRRSAQESESRKTANSCRRISSFSRFRIDFEAQSKRFEVSPGQLTVPKSKESENRIMTSFSMANSSNCCFRTLA